jgi:hypothetical protein
VAISLPLLLILPQMFELMEVVFQGGELTEVVLPDNTPVYLLLFFYGYIMLSVNMYRLVVLGEQAVSAMSPIFDIRQIFRFIGLTLFIGFVTTVPVILTGIGFLQLVIYFLIMPITLNFVHIALHQPSNYKWQLNFVSQANLFLLQAIIPALIGMIFTALFSALGLSDVFGWIVKTVLFYWSLVNLALCYQLIQKANTSA